MKRREGTTSVVRIAPQRGEGRSAGGERSEPPDRRGITICTPAGVAGAPRAPAGARWSRRHGFQGFAKGAHPWLRASAEINSHFGASAGRADARRRDEGDVGHRRGAATKPIRALAAAPLRAAARRPAGFVARSSHSAPGIARRSRLASGPGGLQQNGKLFLREP